MAKAKFISDLDLLKAPKIYTFITAMLYFGIEAKKYINYERDYKRIGYAIEGRP